MILQHTDKLPVGAYIQYVSDIWGEQAASACTWLLDAEHPPNSLHPIDLELCKCSTTHFPKLTLGIFPPVAAS